MSFSIRPLSCAVAWLALLSVSSPASAQVTIHMTTAQQANCDATTDAQGLNLIPGGTDLQATGVTLTGNGCGSGSADFQAAITVPPTATIGQPFNVSWSASQAATQCIYGGTGGITGWPTGTVACQGAACNGSHSKSVTVTASGDYTLSVACTNASGFAQGTGSTIVGPPTPANFALVAPATASVGTPFSVSWAVSGATSCAGSADLNGSSTSLAGWTDSTSPASPRSVTASAAGAYTLSLTCSNASGSVTSQNATVTVSVGDSCPAGRMTTANIRYPNVPGSSIRSNVDLTNYDNIWGHMNNTDSVTPWPGVSGTQPAILNWNRTQYVAAKFHVPTSVNTQQFGVLGYGTYYSGPAMTLSFSTECGDFTPANALCVSTHGAGESFRKWVINPNVNGCPLAPGQDYFVNIKMADQNTSECGGTGVCTGIAINNILGTQ